MAALLHEERATLDAHLPRLDERLAGTPLGDLERPDAPAIEWFRDAGGAALFVPDDIGGTGLGLADGVRLQRALGSRAPSLAVATTMHHFSVASLLDLDDTGTGMEDLLAEAVARNALLIASGAGEGNGSGLVDPQMTARPCEDGLLVNGTKKPCSLSGSMDLLFATVRIVEEDTEDKLALAVIASPSPGLTVRPFWGTPILAGAQSDEVRLEDVLVPRRAVAELGPVGTTSNSLRAALVWFELLIAASYVGICSALLERALAAGKPATQLLDAVTGLEGAALALEAVAMKADAAGRAAPQISAALTARYSAQQTIARASALAVEAIGGRGFVGSGDVAYLHAAANCLPFHPPGRQAAAEAVVAGVHGAPVEIT